MTQPMPVLTPGAIYIRNDGPQIVDTNFWESTLAEAGGMFCSVNAGAVRLLLPRSYEHAIPEMRTGREVLVTRGPWPEMGQREALELLWEDGSAAPYAVHLSAGQLDRLIPRGEAGRRLACHVYTRGFSSTPLLAGTWPARFRVARSLPHLKPWGK